MTPHTCQVSHTNVFIPAFVYNGKAGNPVFITGIHETPTVPIRDDMPDILMEHTNLVPFHRLETYLRFAGFSIETLTTYRLRKGSLLLYPFLYPLARLRFWTAYRKYFRDKPESLKYRDIFKMYLSRAVLCGSHCVLVARKPEASVETSEPK